MEVLRGKKWNNDGTIEHIIIPLRKFPKGQLKKRNTFSTKIIQKGRGRGSSSFNYSHLAIKSCYELCKLAGAMGLLQENDPFLLDLVLS